MKLTSAIALMIGMWVFSGWGSGAIQAAEPSLESSFKESCLQKASLSAERRKTVEVLLEEAGTSDCELAAKNLLSRAEMYLINRQIADVSPLAGLTNLNMLVLSNNQIANVSPLAGLTNLRVLHLDNNQIKDVTPLAKLINLDVLSIGNNRIKDVTPLAKLINLTLLDLRDNQITDVTPLAGLINLNWLYLSNNQITDVSSLTGLTNLQVLYLTGNAITQPTCPVSPPDSPVGPLYICEFENLPRSR